MAAPVGKNYLTICKQFLKEFTATINPNDPLPVKITGYTIDDADLEGEIIDWTLQYLYQKCCPQSLATAIARSVLNEIQIIVREDQELRVQNEEKEVHYDPMRLMHTVIAKVNVVCERYLKEAESRDETKLPPPAIGPPFVSTFAIKNHRRRMEDRHVAIDDLHSLFNINLPGKVGYYAIFDGHHGHEAAAYSAAQLHGLIVHSEHYPKDPEAALRSAFLRADEIFIKKCATSQKLLSGTTVLVALVRQRESLHVAWLGDSLGILVKSGGKVIHLVDPHTAERLDERKRIEDEGGVVIMHFHTWRINGTLAISRAIGDPDCKPHVSAAADVVTHQFDGTEHFLILACDGLWDCVTAEEATASVYDLLRQDPDNYSELSKSLVQLAKSRASNDNISVVVVLLCPIEDILATAPPPTAASPVLEQREALLPADGLALHSTSPHHYLVNGNMDGETAKFDTIHKVPSPEGAMELLAARNGLGIMMSSFYGNGGEDGRDLFGNPCDLGPETDVDLLDDDAGGRAERVQTEVSEREEEEEEMWCGGGMVKERVVSSEEALERVQEKEELEVVGGGVEEEEDDSEDEDAEWRYVPVKSVGGGVAAVSPEPTLEDKPALDTSGYDIDPSDLLELSREVIERVAPGTEDSGFQATFAPKEIAEKLEADENKLCPKLDLEVVQKVQSEESCNLSRALLIQGLENQVSTGNPFLEDEFKRELREEIEDSSDDSTMESRLNPDAAEFVPISPTRNKVPESFPSVGQEFDVFKKEAEACPGEIFDEVSSIPATSVKKEEGFNNLPKMPFDGRTDLGDADLVLSSSFNCEQLNVERIEKVGSAEDLRVKHSSNFVDEEEENKENLPECDDKENILLPTNSEILMTEDVVHVSQDGDVKRLEENKVSSLLDYSDLQIVEDSSASKVLQEMVEIDQVTQEEELEKIEAPEKSNLLTEIEANEEEKSSKDLLQSVKQIHGALSPELFSEEPEEEIQSSEYKVHSFEPVEVVQKSVSETVSSTMDEFEVNQSHEKVVLYGFEEQCVSSTQGQASVDELHGQVNIQLLEPKNGFEKEICSVGSEFKTEEDKQMSNLSMHVEHAEHHEVEQFHEKEIEVSLNEKQEEICLSTSEVSEQIQPSQPEHVLDDILQTPLKEEKQQSEQIQPEHVLDDILQTPPKEEKQQNYHNEGEQYLIEMGKEFDVRSTEEINNESVVESLFENRNVGIECTSIVPGSVLPIELEVKSTTEKVLSPSPVPKVNPIPEASLENLIKSPTKVIDVSSDIPIATDDFVEKTLPVQDDGLKSDQDKLLAHEAVISNSENITPLVDFSAVEPLIQVKEASEMKCEEIPAESNSLQEPPSKAVPETTKEEQTLGETIATKSPMPAVVTPSLPLDAKLPAKKTPSVEKKKVPEKGKVTPVPAAKGKMAAKSPVPPTRTSSATAKTSAMSPTKPTGGMLSSRPTPAERKSAPAAGKPAATSKSASAPLSSKPRTSTLKPSPVPTTRPAPPPKSTTAAARPGTAGTASSKPGLASTASKPASAAAKSSVTQSKVTEVKRTVNGDASKPTTQTSSVPAKAAPRKLPLASPTTASKPSASLTRTSARPASVTQKAASEALSSKPKPQNVVNGTTSKPTRTVGAAASKSAAPLSSQTRRPLPKTATSTVGDPKKAKESANKHISASRAPVGISGIRRSTDVKGNVASKTAAAKGRPSETKVGLSNGTAIKRPVNNSVSIKVDEEKMDLMISENGIAVEGNEVRKEEDSAVQGLCEVKEQVMLIVEEGVREAM